MIIWINFLRSLFGDTLFFPPIRCMWREGVAVLSDHQYFTILKTPEVKSSYLLMAFRGWPDAGEGASGALRYLLKRLAGKKMAEMDPEEFYDFSQVRPHIKLKGDGVRELKWPTNEIFLQDAQSQSDNLLFFLGMEPNLKWRTYCDAVLNLAVESGVHTVVHLGALLDAIPHTRDLVMTGSTTDSSLRERLLKLNIRSSGYQGPSGISSAMMERCTAKGLKFVSLWGHSSHYLQTYPNYKVTYGVVKTVCRVLELEMDHRELEAAASVFQKEMHKVVEEDSQLRSYVNKLETRFDQALVSLAEMPNPEEMVQELERFLKDQLGGSNGG